ncbi:GntR family transcriptional regulator [Flaviramulus basaltis]|uniref:GntR family transcriptional regulator n=1 Tax=Flaviramulus basaltis TaxID=369401 RepID=A0A1K2IPF6_9FLAO|nr:GntR family transcriptional regulator [Flaviramulus basaltis]SFZ93579.1 GntR family transcriptional regulator [Flaviramulus basaltis]
MKGIPKYITISKEIIQKISSGEFQPGDKIPSENELIEIYSISNTTARKSLLEVELQGWAKRIKGKGTFVLNRFEDKHLTRVLGSFNAVKESFTDKLIKEGFTPKNVILEKTILDDGISSNINNRHYIMEGPVLKIHKLRYADETLLKDETKYISMVHCPKINVLDLDSRPLISIYQEKYNLKLINVERTLGNTIFSPREPNNYFENEVPTAIFILDGAIFCDNGKIVEIEQSYYRGDKYKFAITTKPELIKSKVKLKSL